jgi:NifU-like protein involved in Fe-S cluster formation
MEHFRNPRNVGEIPDADGEGTVGNPICLAPDSLVSLNSSLTPIMDASANERVLGHDGHYHRIEKVTARPYKGKMYRIVAHNLGSTVLTPDHHILALRASPFLRKYRSRKRCIRDWYAADELKKGDILLYPVPRETVDVEKMLMDVDRPKYDFKSKTLPCEIAVDDYFLRLLGYYLSGGYLRTERSKGTFGFVFGSKESSYVQDAISCVGRTFGLKPAKINSIHGAIDVSFYSARLARFFSRHFGEGAANKHIPHWIMLLPPEKQVAILCGIWRGDGYINSKVAKYVTISRQLAFQVRDLLLRQGIIMSFREGPASGIHGKSYSIYVKADGSLGKLGKILDMELVMPKKSKNHHQSWFEDGYFHVPIWHMEQLDYDGTVYNLEVEHSHSFASNSMTLHNCGDLMTLYIKIKDDRLEDIKFKTFGCAAAISTSSMITELAKGKSIEEAVRISRNDVADALEGLPPIKMHCSNLAADALKAAIYNYLSKRMTREEIEAKYGLVPPEGHDEERAHSH